MKKYNIWGIPALFLVFVFSCVFAGKLAAQNPSFISWTVAGNGVYGYADGLGTNARFAHPSGITFDYSGNLYIADRDNHRIRKIDRYGQVSTIAGSVQGYQDGAASQALFRYPTGVAVDISGNIYVADNGNHRIRKITPSGSVTTLAGGAAGDPSVGSVSQLTFPYSLVVDPAGNIYVTDNGNFRIRRITPSGAMATLAGSGSRGRAEGLGIAAQFWNPRGIIRMLSVIYMLLTVPFARLLLAAW